MHSIPKEPSAIDCYTDQQLLLLYRFEQTSGIKVIDYSNNHFDAEYVNEASWKESISGNAFTTDGGLVPQPYIKIPFEALQGIRNITIATRIKWTDTAATNQCVFALGADNRNRISLTPKDNSGKLRVMLVHTDETDDSISHEQALTAQWAIQHDVWKYIVLTINSETNTSVLYVDGMEVNRNTAVTLKLSDLCKANKDYSGYIGKSFNWDPPFTGDIDEFRIYSTALNADQVAVLTYEGLTDEQLTAAAFKDLSLGDLSIVTGDIYLPKQLYDTEIIWSSDNTKNLKADGTVIRPAKEEADAKATLIATITKNKACMKKVFTATILPEEAAPYRLEVNTKDIGVDISPRLFGLFFEDINYSLDGGLYPELVQNRSFEYVKSEDDAMIQKPAGMFAWHKLETGGAKITIEVTDTEGIHENNPHYLKMITHKVGTGAGVYNTGFPDSENSANEPIPSICIVKNESYDFSIFTKSSSYKGFIEISLTSADGSKVYASQLLTGINSEWARLNCVLIPDTTAVDARLQILMKEAGELDIDMVSLFPQKTWKNRKNGVRYDLGKLLEDMKPAFFRFPGGCLVEGRIVSNRYKWKDTVGPLEQRRNTFNNWAFSGAYAYYNQSFGFGFFEYFQLAEDLGAEPVPCINAGISHPAKGSPTPTTVPMEEMWELVQDAVDLIDFANCTDMNNPWAKLRAEMGHPEPFYLKYLEIGNENGGELYYDRYKLFSEVLRKAHPDIKLIVGGGFGKNDGINLDTWSRLQNGTLDADLVDDHYYMSPEAFYNSMNQYDNYDRNLSKVFLGEYASWGNAWNNALSEASYMTQLEENGDVVELAAYAPLFAKKNYTQWGTDLIFFSNTEAYATPNYYVQKLFMRNVGNTTIPSEIIKYKDTVHRIYGAIGLGTNRTSVQFADLRVTDNDTQKVLFYDDFTGDAAKWTKVAGEWSICNGSFIQKNSGVSNTLAISEVISSDHYTVTLKVKKITGEEGFLINIGMKDKGNCLRLHIGGWKNSKSAFERIVNGRVSLMTPYFDTARFPSVEEGEWYDIKLIVEGNRVRCFINDVLQFNIVDRLKTGPVYSVASKDAATGDIIIKLTNPHNIPQKIDININGQDFIYPEGLKTVLAAKSLSEFNSFDKPMNISPVTTVEKDMIPSNTVVLAPYSLTIYRFRTKPEA